MLRQMMDSVSATQTFLLSLHCLEVEQSGHTLFQLPLSPGSGVRGSDVEYMPGGSAV